MKGDRKTVLPGAGNGGGGGCCLMGNLVSFRDDGNILELNRGGGCSGADDSVNVLDAAELFTF